MLIIFTDLQQIQSTFIFEFVFYCSNFIRQSKHPILFDFADIEIDTARFELRRSGKALSIEPQVFDLIVNLICRLQEIVSRDELTSNAWSGKIVSDATVSNAIKTARKALGDDGAKQKYIQTVCMGKDSVLSRQPPVSTNSSSKSFHINQKPGDGTPSITAVPFQNLSNDPGLDFESPDSYEQKMIGV